MTLGPWLDANAALLFFLALTHAAEKTKLTLVYILALFAGVLATVEGGVVDGALRTLFVALLILLADRARTNYKETKNTEDDAF